MDRALHPCHPLHLPLYPLRAFHALASPGIYEFVTNPSMHIASERIFPESTGGNGVFEVKPSVNTSLCEWRVASVCRVTYVVYVVCEWRVASVCRAHLIVAYVAYATYATYVTYVAYVTYTTGIRGDAEREERPDSGHLLPHDRAVATLLAGAITPTPTPKPNLNASRSRGCPIHLAGQVHYASRIDRNARVPLLRFRPHRYWQPLPDHVGPPTHADGD